MIDPGTEEKITDILNEHVSTDLEKIGLLEALKYCVFLRNIDKNED